MLTEIQQLLFSGLLKYDAQGNLIKDLAEDYKIQNKGKTYVFTLKDNVFWHDGVEITAEDIEFTVKLIQAPQYQSPLLKEWLGIGVEIEGKNKIKFFLNKTYFSFLETIAQLKILPKHVFKDLSPEDLPWALTSEEYLLGSGPFKFHELKQDKSGYIKDFILKRNENYVLKKPFLSKISFKFYTTEKDLIKAAKNGEVDGATLSSFEEIENLEKGRFEAYHISVPRYFAVFFNEKDSEILKNQNIRKALNYSLNKQEILDLIFAGNGKQVDSPVLSEYYLLNPPSKIYDFNLSRAEEILDAEGFEKNLETGLREKAIDKESSSPIKSDLKYQARSSEVSSLQECLAQIPGVYPEGTVSGYFGPKTRTAVIKFQEKYAEDVLAPIGLSKGTGKVGPLTRKKLDALCFPSEKETLTLEFSLTTVDKAPLPQIAEILKKKWGEIGIKVKIKKVSISTFETEVLKKRDFETLLFGESLSSLLDPFPFWHSSQKEYPGLNISSYNSKQADKFLITARETSDNEDRKEALENFQDTLIEDIPAIFLVKPDYIYLIDSNIKGYNVEKIIEPSKRFSTIEDLFIKTQRTWK